MIIRLAKRTLSAQFVEGTLIIHIVERTLYVPCLNGLLLFEGFNELCLVDFVDVLCDSGVSLWGTTWGTSN